MPRRQRAHASKRRKVDDDDDAPIVVSAKERELFDAEIGGRAERWAEEYSESAFGVLTQLLSTCPWSWSAHSTS